MLENARKRNPATYLAVAVLNGNTVMATCEYGDGDGINTIDVLVADCKKLRMVEPGETLERKVYRVDRMVEIREMEAVDLALLSGIPRC